MADSDSYLSHNFGPLSLFHSNTMQIWSDHSKSVCNTVLPTFLKMNKYNQLTLQVKFSTNSNAYKDAAIQVFLGSGKKKKRKRGHKYVKN